MNKVIEQNVTVLANAVELSARLVMEVAGEAVSNSIGGERLAPATMKSAIAATLQRRLSKDQGVV